MAMTNNQVAIERHKYHNHAWHIYHSAGINSEWFRWRVATGNSMSNGGDDTYPALAGCTRGKVYAGVRKSISFGDESASNAMAGPVARQGAATYWAPNTGAYSQFAVPDNTTHYRLWVYFNSGSTDNITVQYQDAEGDPTGDANETVIIKTLSEVGPAPWVVMPTGAKFIKLTAASAFFAYVVGADFINKNSQVTPDTAGSMMFDGPNGETQTVMRADHWLPYGSVLESVESAVYWNDHESAYSGSNTWGGLAHRGINDGGSGFTNVVTFETQIGTGALTAWGNGNAAHAADNADTRTYGDYVVMNLIGLTVYQTAAMVNARGSLTGKLVFSNNGCLVDYAVTTSAAMDVFCAFTIQFPIPSDVKKVMWWGDNSPQIIPSTENNIFSLDQDKKDGVWFWGGQNQTFYEVSMLNVDSSLLYFSKVASGYFPRININSGGAKKLYFNACFDITTAQLLLGNGDTISTKFKITLTDIRSAKKINPNQRVFEIAP
jgi:hypothetical protein